MTLPGEVIAKSLLPPNATQPERAIEDAMRVGADLSVVGTLWNPETCPPEVLPFLAWGLAISRWDENWTVDEKREQTADAIRFHQRKGTRGIVEEVVERFHPLLQIVEWWEMSPPGAPHTFEVRAPADDVPPSFLTAETVAAIIRDIASVKPVRSHFQFVQSLEAQAAADLASAAMAGTFERFEMAAEHDDDPAWQTYLLTEDGEPLQAEDGSFLEL